MFQTKNLILIVFMLSSSFLNCFIVEKHDTTLPGNFQAFKQYMLEKRLDPQKKALIKNTVLKAKYPLNNQVTWSNVKMAPREFDALIKKPLTKLKFTVTPVNGYYNYAPNDHYWVDFAAATHFGGGFRSRGNVQEERMFMEFPELSQLAFAKRRNSILPIESSCTHIPLTANCAEPFVVYNISRLFNISQVPYGRALLNAAPASIKNQIKKLNSPFAKGNIIGIAANNWSSPRRANKKYSLEDLKYTLKAAILGNLAAIRDSMDKKKAAPNVHTGNLGAGAFKNSTEMMIAIRVLAAAMSQIPQGPFVNGVNLFYHGDPVTLQGNKAQVQRITKEILGMIINKKMTPEQILIALLYKQKVNPKAWAPQQ